MISLKESLKMRTTKVAKFGGTSMATPASLKSVLTIIQQDPTLEFIVVSAPGKRFKGDIKVTDLLFSLADEFTKLGTFSSFNLVEDRFLILADSLNLKADFVPILRNEERNYVVAIATSIHFGSVRRVDWFLVAVHDLRAALCLRTVGTIALILFLHNQSIIHPLQ
jgi:aspartokinase